jgi:hypothetical protein
MFMVGVSVSQGAAMLTTATAVAVQRPPHRFAPHFSLDEALAKVGRQVRVVCSMPDVPENTIGTVLAVSGGNDRAMVLVEWTVWRKSSASRQTTPLGRWFNRPDYEGVLIEI